MPSIRTPTPAYDPANPLIVQGDRSILVETFNPRYAEARDALAPFAELEKSPEHIHTYRLTTLSLWNAAAAGLTAEEMIEVLQQYSKFPLPTNLPADIAETVSRYGRVKLERLDESRLRLRCADRPCSKNWPGSRRSASTSATGSTTPASPSSRPIAACSSRR